MDFEFGSIGTPEITCKHLILLHPAFPSSPNPNPKPKPTKCSFSDNENIPFSVYWILRISCNRDIKTGGTMIFAKNHIGDVFLIWDCPVVAPCYLIITLVSCCSIIGQGRSKICKTVESTNSKQNLISQKLVVQYHWKQDNPTHINLREGILKMFYGL